MPDFSIKRNKYAKCAVEEIEDDDEIMTWFPD
jgi:hypothetical protein